jgi:dihydrofolate reductase
MATRDLKEELMGKSGQDRGGRVLWHVTKSLDGCITRPDDATDWTTRCGGWTHAAREAVANIGANLAGRRGYDVYEGQDDVKPYGGNRAGPILILTHRPFSPAVRPPGITFLSDDIECAVATLEAAEGKDAVLFGSTIPMSESIERRQ